jgi:hypothetical protein
MLLAEPEQEQARIPIIPSIIQSKRKQQKKMQYQRRIQQVRVGIPQEQAKETRLLLLVLPVTVKARLLFLRATQKRQRPKRLIVNPMPKPVKLRHRDYQTRRQIQVPQPLHPRKLLSLML